MLNCVHGSQNILQNGVCMFARFYPGNAIFWKKIREEKEE